MFSDYNTKTGIQVNYQSIGSGGGILQLTNKTVDFGASDGPLNDEQTTKIGVPVLHIPQASGAVVITYNLPGNNNLISLTPDIIADIFLGKIKTWNDRAELLLLIKELIYPLSRSWLRIVLMVAEQPIFLLTIYLR